MSSVLENEPGGPPPALQVERHALFLDLDGTLVELAARPDGVHAEAQVLQRLRELGGAMRGALAVVTGRTLADAERILCGAVDSIAGLHGREKSGDAGGRAAPENVRSAALRVRALVGSGALDARIEDKGGGVALHYRHAPAQGEAVRRAAEAIATEFGLSVLHGKMVAEILPPGATKYDAVVEFMAQPIFAGRTPIAVGDDATDENAFAAAAELGGFGVLVGPARATCAKYRLDGVLNVHAWLNARGA